MKVEVIRKFVDKHTGEVHYRGEVLEMTQERYEEILTVGRLVTPIPENDEQNQQNDAQTDGAADMTDISEDDAERAEAPADAPNDALDEMNVRELREYASENFGLTFRVGMKKSDMIDEIRRAANGE